MALNFGGRTAGNEPGALLAAERAIGQHAIALLGRDHRPELGQGIEGITDANGAGLHLQLRDELVIDRSLHKMARGADAGLPGADEGAERGVIDGAIDVVVVEHQHRRLAAKLQRLVREHFRGSSASGAAGLGAAGQHQLVDVGMLGEHPAGAMAQAQHDVEHAARQPRFGKDLRQLERRQRRIFRRFRHAHTTRGGHRGQRLAQDHQGMIERRAIGDDADRRAQGVIEVRSFDGNDGVAARQRQPCEVTKKVRQP